VKSQAVEQLNLTDNLSSNCVEMLDSVLEMIKKLTGANVEHAALIANSKILTLFSRFVIVNHYSVKVKLKCFLRSLDVPVLFHVSVCFNAICPLP